MRRELSTSGLPPSDFTFTSPTLDISSDPLRFPSPHYLPYRDANRDNDRHNSDSGSKSHIKVSSPRSCSRSRWDGPWEVARKRARRSSDRSTPEAAAIPVGGGGRERERSANALMSPSQFASGSSVFVSKRKHLSASFYFVFVFRPPFGYSSASFGTLFENSTGYWLRSDQKLEPASSTSQNVCYVVPRRL